MKIIIPIHEIDLKKKYQIGEEIVYRDYLRGMVVSGKIIAIVPDPSCMDIVIIAEIINERKFLKEELGKNEN